jgi:hypothetical protein
MIVHQTLFHRVLKLKLSLGEGQVEVSRLKFETNRALFLEIGIYQRFLFGTYKGQHGKATSLNANKTDVAAYVASQLISRLDVSAQVSLIPQNSIVCWIVVILDTPFAVKYGKAQCTRLCSIRRVTSWFLPGN